MTRVDKSPEQLDAEAQPEPLPQRIRFHRQLARAEVWIPRLHVRGAGGGYSTATNKGEDLPDPQVREPTMGAIGWTGMEFNPQFGRFLDEQYGTAYPWSAGLKSLRAECRRSHSEHWHRPEWRGSLCYQLVSLVIRFDYSFGRACYDLHVTPERTEPVMQRALKLIEERLADLQARTTSTVESDKGRHDWMAPVYEHRAVGGFHAEDCHNPVCRARRAA